MFRYYTAFAEDDLLATWMRKASLANTSQLEDVVELSPRADPSSAKAYAQAGLVLDDPTAVPTVKDTKTVNVSRDFCLSAGREDRSSRPVSGAISRSPSVRGIIPPRSPSTRTTRTVAGGDLNLRTNWRAITATSQLRSRRLQNQYQSGKKPNAPGSSGKTTQTGRANGPGIALRSHDTHKNACARFEKQST